MTLLAFFLAPATALYAAAVWIRGRCYDSGCFRVERLAVPVISVGNMSAGGTGKTPLVEALVRLLRADGKRVAVVSRGYRREGTGTFVVSDGTTLFGSARTAGDEPYQIARKFPTVVVIVDERKARAARYAVERCGAEVVLVDDGFQHRSLARDLDIVVVDSTKELRRMPLLPSGWRREPMSALSRADAIVYSRCDDPAHAHEAFPEAPGGAVRCCVRSALVRCVALADLAERSLGSLRGAAVVAFCAIGDPASFERTLRETGCDVRGFYPYPDHHAFSAGALKVLCEHAARADARHLLTTEKDAVRILADPALAALLPPQAAFLEIRAEFVRGGEEFLGRLRAAAARSAA